MLLTSRWASSSRDTDKCSSQFNAHDRDGTEVLDHVKADPALRYHILVPLQRMSFSSSTWPDMPRQRTDWINETQFTFSDRPYRKNLTKPTQSVECRASERRLLGDFPLTMTVGHVVIFQMRESSMDWLCNRNSDVGKTSSLSSVPAMVASLRLPRIQDVGIFVQTTQVTTTPQYPCWSIISMRALVANKPVTVRIVYRDAVKSRLPIVESIRPKFDLRHNHYTCRPTPPKKNRCMPSKHP
jgi:hypothetical protein